MRVLRFTMETQLLQFMNEPPPPIHSSGEISFRRRRTAAAAALNSFFSSLLAVAPLSARGQVKVLNILIKCI